MVNVRGEPTTHQRARERRDPEATRQALLRALQYRVVELQTLQRIAWFCMSQGETQLPYADVDESFRQRPAYQEGCLTDEPDLSRYDELSHEDPSDPSESEDDHE